MDLNHQRREAALQASRRCYDSLAASRAPLCKPPVTTSSLIHYARLIRWDGWALRCWLAGAVFSSGRWQTKCALCKRRRGVTVVDISPAMLELDRAVARERKLSIRPIQTSMDQLEMLTSNQFDLVIHPVSSCYLPDVRRVFAEVARVLRDGGLYVSQHKSPVSLQASSQPDGSSSFGWSMLIIAKIPFLKRFSKNGVSDD